VVLLLLLMPLLLVVSAAGRTRVVAGGEATEGEQRASAEEGASRDHNPRHAMPMMVGMLRLCLMVWICLGGSEWGGLGV
jgi:hypothetical protein